jgi:hypothetical protein
MAMVALTGVSSAQAAALPNQITAHNQDLNTGVIVLDSVTAAQAGWVVIYKNPSLTSGEIVGIAPIQAGTNTNVKVTIDPANKDQAIVTWDSPTITRERQYLDIPIGYRVYRRIGPMALNDRPWFPVATLGPDARSFTVDLKQRPEDIYWFAVTDCFAVSTLGELSVESELVETR